MNLPRAFTDIGHLRGCRFYADPDIPWCWCPDVVDVRRNPDWYAAATRAVISGMVMFPAIMDALEFRESFLYRWRRRWDHVLHWFSAPGWD